VNGIFGTTTLPALAAGQWSVDYPGDGVDLNVRPAPVASMDVTPATSTIASGTTVQLTATPRDAGGNPLTGRTVTWASSDPTIASVDVNGLVQGALVGTATITATSEGVDGTATVTVNPGTASSLQFTVQPSAVTAGQVITPAVQVTVRDAAGNVVPTLANPVTIAIGNNAGGATLGGTTNQSVVSGVATFADLTLDAAGTGYTLVASAPGLASATSTAFDVSPAPTSSGPIALVSNSGSNTMSIYRASSGTGALASLGTVATGTYPYAVVITPNGRFAYVTNLVGGNLSSYSIDDTAGTVTPLALSSPGITNPYGIAMDPLGRFVWAVSYSTHKVYTFAIDSSTGVLAAGVSAATGTYPYNLAAHPSGQYVYVVNEVGNSVSSYGVNPTTGALTLMGSAANCCLSPHAIAVTPDGAHAYVANSGGGNVTMFSIDGSGALTTTGYTTTGSGPEGIAVHPSGQFLYVANSGSNTVSVFSITNGALAAVGSAVPTEGSPSALTISMGGDFLYVVNAGSNSVSTFSIGADGTLTPVGAPVGTGSGPYGIAITP